MLLSVILLGILALVMLIAIGVVLLEDDNKKP